MEVGLFGVLVEDIDGEVGIAFLGELNVGHFEFPLGELFFSLRKN